ncbi:MAG: ABC transporter ATP-binding protein [Lachnospiraceae bacterium]|uniref:ABC transporter ATP-binding protein n=1 Tax=Candidatus Merdisoma sp. JLR.KK011 TaxID=3114299 RepID=UPI0029DE3952|nr:ABC transporter ATP-binding protein [Lachnospiraceae bacterium]MCI9251830.1 ABC transporter ATP-binding protein [Lachnospiraceae bacterium]MCI9478059.1 ABC transporter ATP-binding protein [Lachnospiraceae bacterium]MCI9623071.1 ABC transporter ATP-binding protein [Lachnospiraceae bacterium]
MSILKLSDVSYRYTEKTAVLYNLNAAFECGRMYVIFGPSGCGKTTLLSLIGGLDSPTEGNIYFYDQDIASYGLDKHRQNNISFIFQNYNLIDYMTPEENVLLTAKEAPLPLLEKLGLTKEESKRNVLKLSGGQQQRTAIARALASQNPIILADEPTGNLDEASAKEITGIFKDAAHHYGRCVIIVSHSMETAKEADMVYELKGGRLCT